MVCSISPGQECGLARERGEQDPKVLFSAFFEFETHKIFQQHRNKYVGPNTFRCSRSHCQLLIELAMCGMQATLLIFFCCYMLNLSHSLSTVQKHDNPWKIHILQDSEGATLGQCTEFFPEDDRPDEDELEMLFPTVRRRFAFGTAINDGLTQDKIMIRQTSFGCGKLGYQVWPSSIALSLYLCNHPEMIKDQNIMELGAGCGLPSAVCRDLLGARFILATDFWMVSKCEQDRLIPESWHGINLKFNVETSPKAKAQHVDWFNPDTVRHALEVGQPNIVVGSDLIYYPTDLWSLWNTIEICLKDGDVDEVILISPLKPDVREALPEFRKMLENKGGKEYNVKIRELSLHCNEIGNSVDTFLSMSIALK